MKNKRLYINGLTADKYGELYIYISDMVIDKEIELEIHGNVCPGLFDIKLTCTESTKSIKTSMDEDDLSIEIETKKYSTLFSLNHNEYVTITL